jgi:hypothetical protein
MKRLALILALSCDLFAQSSGVGSIWTTVQGTLQSSAVANGNGTALAVQGLATALVTVNCSVACSGGTTVTFQVSQDGTNYSAVTAQQKGTTTIASTVANQGTTPTVWTVDLTGAQYLRAPISGYSAGTVTVTATAVANSPGPNAVNVANSVTLAALPAGSNTIGALTANQSVNVAQVAGSTASTAATGVQKVGIVGNAGGAVDQATGSAVPANAVMAGFTDGTNTQFQYLDPCKGAAKTFTVINQASSSATTLVAGTSSKKTYVCAISIWPLAAAVNISIVEGTGTNCSSISAGLFGGTTAANGGNFAINGGLTYGNGDSAIAVTTTAADNLCILDSSSGQVSGNIVTVQR